MASTNKTTNYELSQFEGTDKPSWEADYNADMLSIDTNLKAVSDVANGASGDISTLDGRLTTAEGNISTNANDIDALEARADALEAGQTSDDSRLDALEAEQIVQNTAIEGNTQLGYNIARPYDSASTYSVGDYALFQNTLYKCTTAVTTGETFDPTKWTAIKVMDEVSSGAINIETIPLTTSLFTPLSHFYNSYNTPYPTNVTRPSGTTLPSTINFVSGYYIKINNIRILQAEIGITANNPVTVSGSSLISEWGRISYDNTVIDSPSRAIKHRDTMQDMATAGNDVEITSNYIEFHSNYRCDTDAGTMQIGNYTLHISEIYVV